MPWLQPQLNQKDVLLNPSVQPLPIYFSQKESISPTVTPSSSSGSKISPGVLFFIVILAVIFFISGVLHLLLRFLMKHRPSLSFSQSSRTTQEIPNSGAVQRQLQQLFHLHDSGLDQAFIDALPVFSYKDIMGGLKEPFDCAVCLCEFSDQDGLRLLPLCGHAFHIECIDTWLLSNSTCPLCRGILFAPDFCIENPVFYFDDSRDEDGVPGTGSAGIAVSSGSKPGEDDNVNAILTEKRVFSVRLGKFRTTNNVEVQEKEIGETSNSNLDARRCFSMGSFQYVVGDSELQVTLGPGGGGGGGNRQLKAGRGRGGGQNGNFTSEGDSDGKKIINMRSKGESFSVSKIWLWSKKDKFPTSANTHISTSINTTTLPWTHRLEAP